MGRYNRELSARWSFGLLYSRGCYFQGGVIIQRLLYTDGSHYVWYAVQSAMFRSHIIKFCLGNTDNTVICILQSDYNGLFDNIQNTEPYPMMAPPIAVPGNYSDSTYTNHSTSRLQHK